MPDLRMSRSPRSASTGRVRLVRAGVLGGLSLLLATGAHLLGGGSLPGAGVLLIAAVLLGLTAAVVTVRRCRLGLLTALLGVQQLALHELFRLAGATQTCALGATGVDHTTHAGGAGLLSCAPGADMQMTGGGPSWVMASAHLVAVLGTAWLLARGEAWLWRAVDRVAAAAGLTGGRRPTARRDGEPARHADMACRRAAWTPAAPRGPPLALAR